MSHWAAVRVVYNGNRKLGVEKLPSKPIWVRRMVYSHLNFILFFYYILFFSSWILISTPVSTKLGLLSPSLAYFRDNSDSTQKLKYFLEPKTRNYRSGIQSLGSICYGSKNINSLLHHWKINPPKKRKIGQNYTKKTHLFQKKNFNFSDKCF